jgi:hypothetical protein
MSASYAATRHSLHGLAEVVLAGPRYVSGGSMRLRADPEGLRTWEDPPVQLSRGELVVDGARIPLDGLTFSEAAAAAGLVAQPLDHVYHDGPQVSVDERVVLDPAHVSVVEDALADGNAALRSFAPKLEPILWPEHFDIAIMRDDVNYGVSPGDGHHERPYAYVGPHESRRGAFWNAPFGAARPMADFSHTASLVAFFEEGARGVPLTPHATNASVGERLHEHRPGVEQREASALGVLL